MGITSKRAMKRFFDICKPSSPIAKVPRKTDHNEDVFTRCYEPLPEYGLIKFN